MRSIPLVAPSEMSTTTTSGVGRERVDCRARIDRLAADHEIRLGREQPREPVTDDRMIVDEQDAYRRRRHAARRRSP